MKLLITISLFPHLVLAVAYLVTILIFGSLFWVLFSLWKQLLSKSKVCAKCKEVFVWRNKDQILCDKCRDFVGICKEAMRH